MSPAFVALYINWRTIGLALLDINNEALFKVNEFFHH